VASHEGIQRLCGRSPNAALPHRRDRLQSALAGKATVSFGLTKGESKKAYKSETYKITIS